MKRQISLFPGKCEVCGKPEPKFVCCKDCLKTWVDKNLKNEQGN